MSIAVIGSLRSALVLLSSVVAVTAALLGCDSVSEFERQNPNDPGSDQFTPDPLQALSVDIRKDSAIVTWQGGTEFESGYVVERMIDSSGTFTAVAELPRNTITYREKLPKRGIYVTYRVRPVSDYANTDSVLAGLSETAPRHDRNTFVVNAAEDRETVVITWQHRYAGIDSFRVYHSFDSPQCHPQWSDYENGPATYVASVSSDRHSWVDSTYVRGERCYFLSAVDNGLESPWSSLSDSPSAIVPDIRVARIENDAVNTDPNRTSLSWEMEARYPYHDTVIEPSGVLLEELRDDRDWVQIARLPGDARRYTIPDRDPGRAYTYRIRSMAGPGSSPVHMSYGEDLAPRYSFPFRPKAVAFSPDGDRLFAIAPFYTDVEPGSIHVMDLKTGIVTQWRSAPSSAAGEMLGMSPDGRRILYIAPDLENVVLDAETGDIQYRLSSDLRQPSFAWSPDGSTLVLRTGSAPNEITVLDLETGMTDVDQSLRTESPIASLLAFANGNVGFTLRFGDYGILPAGGGEPILYENTVRWQRYSRDHNGQPVGDLDGAYGPVDPGTGRLESTIRAVGRGRPGPGRLISFIEGQAYLYRIWDPQSRTYRLNGARISQTASISSRSDYIFVSGCVQEIVDRWRRNR
jgi:WD40 repeat protein